MLIALLPRPCLGDDGTPESADKRYICTPPAAF